MTREEYHKLDEKISEIRTDEEGVKYYMCNGKKIVAMECKTDYDRKKQRAIMRFLASGFDRPSDLLKALYG